MKGSRLLVIVGAWLLPAAGLAAADPTLVASCNECHGERGVSTRQEVPTIAGLSAGVHDDALKAFRSRSRPCTEVGIPRGDGLRRGDMCSVAGRLSDPEIAALAEHYALLPFAPMKQPFDAARAAAGQVVHERDCKSCHSRGGRDAGDEAGILGGQPIGYLKTVLADLKAGRTEQPRTMQERIRRLTDADLEALAHFYGSEQ